MNRLVGLVFLSLLSSCATVMSLGESETRNKVYSGTVRHVELKCAHAVCLDFPFSLIADTLLLPITVPWTLINFATGEPAMSSAPPTASQQGK